MNTVRELIDHLRLEEIGDGEFRGGSLDIGTNHVFGGQVLGQALHAAQRTVPDDRQVHSLHAYFILPGDLLSPLYFDVDYTRDGGSFTTRRVKVSQHGKAIFVMAASFHKKEEGYDHQHVSFPEGVPDPENLKNWEELSALLPDAMPEAARRFLDVKRPIEFRPTNPYNPMLPQTQNPVQRVWLKARGDVSEMSPAEQAQALVYASDYNLLSTVLMPHEGATMMNTKIASLDHAIWFHRPVALDDWMLYEIESPVGGSSRGFAQGRFYDKRGGLVASVAQEGLVRQMRHK